MLDLAQIRPKRAKTPSSPTGSKPFGHTHSHHRDPLAQIGSKMYRNRYRTPWLQRLGWRRRGDTSLDPPLLAPLPPHLLLHTPPTARTAILHLCPDETLLRASSALRLLRWAPPLSLSPRWCSIQDIGLGLVLGRVCGGLWCLPSRGDMRVIFSLEHFSAWMETDL
jgi:hypothetical protein